MHKTILEEATYEIEIERSKFLSFVFHIKDIEEIKNILQNVQKAHHKANHHCYAYVINENNYKCSDDGEPSQSAGAPILDVIKGNNLQNVLIIVVRYFGGIKLGVGGLIKAYTSAAQGVIGKSQIYEVNSYPHYSFKVPYNLVDIVDYFIKSNKITVINKSYEVEVSYTIYVEDKSLIDKLNNTLQGKVNIEFLYDKEVLKKEVN